MSNEYKAIVLFLLALSALLAIFILFKGLNIYQDSKAETEQNWQPSLQCVSYIYSVKGISYQADAQELVFTFENKLYSDAEITSITVTSDMQQIRTLQKRLVQGTEAKITLPGFAVGKNFTIYPDNCRIYAKTCFPATNECIGYE